ncbi:MAG: PQQ-binding-like beta-propeller repeat protein [Acidobacteria bacterium]|nr:PQQ-binding-like beta-propeller repeat protein [Acidobacteriota bacterium]
MRVTRISILALAVLALGATPAAAQDELPTGELAWGTLLGTFSLTDGYYISVEFGDIAGTIAVEGNELAFTATGEGTPPTCVEPGTYTYYVEDGVLHMNVISDACDFRRLIFDTAAWRPSHLPYEYPDRVIKITTADVAPSVPTAAPEQGAWPAFRGAGAAGVAHGMSLPAEWSGETGEHVLWHVPVPGLAHASPVVWGDLVFITTAISEDETASFKPGLYGDGIHSEDRSNHRWIIQARDKHSGEMIWERIAYEGVPNEKRHIKSTYASATPVTDGRVVVASFGSQGTHAYTVDGEFLWNIDMGHVNVGAYNAPSIEWGTASSPYLWEGKVYLQVDTQEDDFIMAVDALSGEVVWKTDRDDLPSWGTPIVVPTRSGPELVTNGSNFIRGYDANTGAELWRLGGSSPITAPTPIFTDEHIVVTSGRDQRPLFVHRHGVRGDVTLPENVESSEDVVWSKQRRGPYMPTPIIYEGILYILANNGVFDAYDLETGEEIYRQRIPHAGSGFSASPIAADGKIYLPNEDGDIFVIKAGREFEHLGTNSMGELLMATPALSEGVMYVRSVDSLFAIGSSE